MFFFKPKTFEKSHAKSTTKSLIVIVIDGGIKPHSPSWRPWRRFQHPSVALNTFLDGGKATQNHEKPEPVKFQSLGRFSMHLLFFYSHYFWYFPQKATERLDLALPPTFGLRPHQLLTSTDRNSRLKFDKKRPKTLVKNIDVNVYFIGDWNIDDRNFYCSLQFHEKTVFTWKRSE